MVCMASRNRSEHMVLKMSNKELELAWTKAYSIENMQAHGAEGRETEYIGTIIKNRTSYLFYKDSTGAYWYRSKKAK